MIDRAYKNYFAELNSLDSQSKKIKEISQRIKDFKIYSNNASKSGNSSFVDEKSNFLNLNINYKNFENEFDSLLQLILKDKFFDKEEYQIVTNKISDMFNISVELNCIRENFHNVIFNSEFFKISFDEKSKKHFLKLINKQLNIIFSKKVMSVTANRVDASMENICKELHKFNNKIVDVCGSVKQLDNLLLKNNFDFKLLFQKGNFVNYQIKHYGKEDFNFVLGLMSHTSIALMNSLILMSSEYKKYSSAFNPINTYFKNLNYDDNFDVATIENKVKEIFENVKSNNIASLNKIMEEERKAKLQKKILKYVSYIVGGLLAIWAAIALIGFLWTNYPVWTLIGGCIIIYGIYKLATS